MTFVSGIGWLRQYIKDKEEQAEEEYQEKVNEELKKNLDNFNIRLDTSEETNQDEIKKAMQQYLDDLFNPKK